MTVRDPFPPALLLPPTHDPLAAPARSCAGWGRRAAARLLDGLLAAPLVLVVLVSPAAYPLLAAALLLGTGWLEGTRGATPGKRALGLRVVRADDGRLLGAGRGTARSVLHLLDCVLLVGYLWPLWDRRRQTFADRLVGAAVVRR